MGGNFVSDIPDGSFDSLVKLETLDISKNKLGTVRKTDFSKLTKLKVCNTSYHRLLRCLCDTRSLTCLFLFTLTTFQTTFLPQLDSADDTILYITFKPKIETVALQKDRNKLGKWAKTWNMEFNLKKCPSACILSMLRLAGMLKKKRRLIVLLTSWRLRTLPGSLSSSIICRCVTSQCGTDYFYVQAFLYARLFSLNASICRRFQTKCRFTPTTSARGAHPKTYLAEPVLVSVC